MKKHILIVDDDQSILEAVQILLEIDGFQVTLFKEAHRIEEKLHQLKPDLILLDLLLSGVDGRDVARKIKADPAIQHIPIILMSAATNIKEKAEEAQVDDFIKKPFDIDELEKAIKRFL